MTDADLLQSYADSHSEEAFRGLIARYINLVYSACVRQLRDAHLAEDATQAVFILLHQRGGKIRKDRISGWVLTASRYTCANIRKAERRRAHREQVVAMLENKQTGQDEEIDEELLQMLDEALSKLSASDREAVSLRYFQQVPLCDVGVVLGISEEAARKRINRAVDKLRSYFARHGIDTSSIALAALLPTQAHAAALTASITESLTRSILQTCQVGAASSAPAMAIAKGTHLMMLAKTIKTVATTIFVFAILISAGWWGLSRSTQAQSVAPVAVAAPAAVPMIALDLSTPEKTLESYCNALRAGDRAGVYACMIVDPKRAVTAGDAFCSLNIAQNHLMRATAKAFSTSGQEARQFPTLDLFLSQVLAYDRMTQQAAIVTGDTAVLQFNLPDAILNTFPSDIQKQVHSFEGHPIHFVKQGNDWKLGMSLTNPGKSIEVTITLLDENHQRVSNAELEIKVVQEYAAIYNQMADAIEAGLYATWDDAHTALKADVDRLHTQNNLSDINIELGRPGESSR